MILYSALLFLLLKLAFKAGSCAITYTADLLTHQNILVDKLHRHVEN